MCLCPSSARTRYVVDAGIMEYESVESPRNFKGDSSVRRIAPFKENFDDTDKPDEEDDKEDDEEDDEEKDDEEKDDEEKDDEEEDGEENDGEDEEEDDDDEDDE